MNSSSEKCKDCISWCLIATTHNVITAKGAIVKQNPKKRGSRVDIKNIYVIEYNILCEGSGMPCFKSQDLGKQPAKMNPCDENRIRDRER